MFQDIYEEMGALSSSVQREMLNCTYPALYIVMFAIMEVIIVWCKRILKELLQNQFYVINSDCTVVHWQLMLEISFPFM